MATKVYRSRPLGKYFLIRSQLNTALVLEVKDGSDKPGVSVVINEPERSQSGSRFGNDHQLWYYDSDSATIRTKLNGFCLDVQEDEEEEDGESELVVQPYSSKSHSQRWIFCDERIQTEDDFEVVVSIVDAKIQTPAQLFQVDEMNNGQKWIFEYSPAPIFYIRCSESEKVLDVRKADTKPGAKVIVFEDKGDMADNQLWYEDQNGIIRSKLTGFAFDASGKEIIMLPYDKIKEWQQWVICGNAVQNRVNPHYVMEMKAGMKLIGESTVFVAEHDTSNPHQCWRINYVSDDPDSNNHAGKGKHFIIRSRLTGLVLELEGGKPTAGGRIITGYRNAGANANTAPHQLFYVDEITGTIRTTTNNYCIDLQDNQLVINPYDPYRQTQQWKITGKKLFSRGGGQEGGLVLTLDYEGSNEPGTTVSAQPDTSQDTQFWDIDHQSARCFYVVSQLNHRVLDVKGEAQGAGAKVIMYDRKPEVSANQLWYEDENGIIRSKLNGYVLESPPDKPEPIRLKPFNSTNKNQFWIIVGDRIQNKYDNKIVLDIYKESKKNGATLCAYKFTGSENQRWTFEYV